MSRDIWSGGRSPRIVVAGACGATAVLLPETSRPALVAHQLVVDRLHLYFPILDQEGIGAAIHIEPIGVSSPDEKRVGAAYLLGQEFEFTVRKLFGKPPRRRAHGVMSLRVGILGQQHDRFGIVSLQVSIQIPLDSEL